LTGGTRGRGGGRGFVAKHFPKSGREVVDLFVAREEVHIDDEELVPVGSGGGRGEDGRKELRMVRDENIEPKERQPEAFFQMESDVLESL
jgi:hypothetical protein